MRNSTLKSLLLAAAALTAGSAMAQDVYLHAVQEGDTHESGAVVQITNEDGESIGTLMFGDPVEGAAAFKAGKKDATRLADYGFVAYTEGNGVNGLPDPTSGSTAYTITLTQDAHVIVGVVLNADKDFFILEDGIALADYNAIRVSEKYYGTYTFDATAGKAYRVYCDGSKLGFYGARVELTAAEEPEEPETPEEPEGEGMVVEGYKYALTVDEAHASGDVVTLKDDGSVVATLTYGEAGGADFAAAVADTDNHVEGYPASTGGNGVNGDKAGGTFYTIAPTIDAKITVAVILNADKKFYIEEDGTALPDYNAMTVSEKYYGTYTFNATAGKSYKVYCAGSKLGFYGFEMSVGPTGIEAIEAKAATGVSYDLMGRRATDKGLMIRDGKVILVK